jgi:purine-binding chemotaxis protein CheW
MKKLLSGDELLVVFAMVGDTTIGIDIQSIVSIIEYGDIRKVPLASKYINTITNFHGQIITLFDIKIYFGSNKPSSPVEKKIIYLKMEDKEQHIGLIVDKITEIDYVSPSCLKTFPKKQSSGAKTKFFKGLFEINEDSPGIHWLSTEKIEEFVNGIEMNV